MQQSLAERIANRANGHGHALPNEQLRQLSDYLALLAKWNRKINLTAFDLEAPSEEAIDRLVIEPLAAARYIGQSDRFVIDIGSGSGSPALPLRIAAPQIALLMIEARERKAAFLREAVRQLCFADTEVLTARVEAYVSVTEIFRQADIVTFRAVRADAGLWSAVRRLLRPGGRVFWFGTTSCPEGWQINQRDGDLAIISLA